MTSTRPRPAGKCREHPNYKGKKPPSRNCEGCRAWYDYSRWLRTAGVWDDICWHLGIGRWGQ